MDSRLGRNHVAHAIVFETDDGVRNLANPRERFLRLRVAAFSLERKRQRRENDDQRAGFARDLRDHAAPRPSRSRRRVRRK